jgi:carboxylesterase
VQRIAVIHGMGGTAATVRPLAEALGAAGHRAVAITLPGHGTRPEDLLTAAWQQWLDAVPTDATVLVGQSMGASLALAAAARRTDVRAVVAINPVAADADALDALQWMTERGRQWVEVPPSTVGEVCYERIPVAALMQMHDGILITDLSAVTCPVLVITSADDDVVDPANSDVVAASVSAPVQRLILDDGGHVATLGPRAADIAEAITLFLRSEALQHAQRPANPRTEGQGQR